MPRKSIKNNHPPLADIAKALAISVRRVSQLKEIGMPVHSIEAAKAWRTDQHEGDDTAAALRKERIRLVRLQATKAELELSIRRGEFISREENEASDAAISIAMSAMMAALINNLPPKLSGKGEAEMRGIIRSELIAVIKMYKDEKSDYWKSHPLTD